MSSEPAVPNSPVDPAQGDDDRELDDFLAGRSALNAAYREATRGDHAPAALEAPVVALARAAQAQAAGTQVLRPVPSRPRWLPLAAAAVAFGLSLSVMLRLREGAVEPAVSRAHRVSVERHAAGGAGTRSLEQAAEAESARVAAQVATVPARKPLEQASGTVARSPAPAPALAPPAPASPPPPAATDPRFAASAKARTFSQEVAPAPAQAAVPPADAMPHEPEARRLEAAPGAATTPAPSAGAMVESDSGSAAASAHPPMAAQAWLGDILELQQRGEHERARDELLRFRRRYPDHPLPAQLQPLATTTEPGDE
jgi:hypothetical protein